MTSLPVPYPVAVVGVGNMGGAMAARLLAQGWPVQVHDIDPQRHAALIAVGATAHASPAQAASGCTAVIVCVVDATQCEQVLFGPLGLAGVMRPGSMVMLCPTIAPQDTESLAGRLARHGIEVLDAPMSGGPARAREGSMSLMLAGPDQLVARHDALLNALSSRIFRISERVGDGARTKLVNNLAAGINLVAAAEVLAMARAMGLELGRTLDVIEQSSGQSWIGSDRMRRAIAGDYAPRAHMTLLEKDTHLALQAAQAAGYSGPLGAAAAQVFARASAAGLADLDDAALLRWLEGPS
ncbi:NAD(P)-dependent oxidoreductase [Curvibacter sp. PAE-UM]|uniref:NAD(P)-dependent oxidoreductase n=1 Tax=Curvibacter sp. PAE-UM TaxID=1714344 RepID=UPI00070C7126|nr:NAD(P)-dependent oxidoreductase [Curvibacter sp. PAE-UM]KRI01669.1 hydroxyacid dehydrogenase [Curvibacter sp. PAE-UM]